jgi:hypothetical protein
MASLRRLTTFLGRVSTLEHGKVQEIRLKNECPFAYEEDERAKNAVVMGQPLRRLPAFDVIMVATLLE